MKHVVQKSLKNNKMRKSTIVHLHEHRGARMVGVSNTRKIIRD
jgi:hypothetical protein